MPISINVSWQSSLGWCHTFAQFRGKWLFGSYSGNTRLSQSPPPSLETPRLDTLYNHMGCCFSDDSKRTPLLDEDDMSSAKDAAVTNLPAEEVAPRKTSSDLESDENKVQARNRFQAYRELYETEVIYCQDIQLVVDVFLNPLKAAAEVKKLGIAEEDIDIIFSRQLEILLSTNLQLLRKIESGLPLENKELLSSKVKETPQQKKLHRRNNSTM